MAGEVGLQSDVYLEGTAKPRTLHLKTLRRPVSYTHLTLPTIDRV